MKRLVSESVERIEPGTYSIVSPPIECFQMVSTFNIRRKALGHLMKSTQLSIPYRFGLASWIVSIESSTLSNV